MSLPIYCIFKDDLRFEFFKFERNPTPSFIHGCFPGHPIHLQHGLELPNFTTMESSLPYILQLRCICEVIFDTMLCTYIAGLKACYNRSLEMEKKGWKSMALDGWDQVLQSAECALAAFREAEGQCRDGVMTSNDYRIFNSQNQRIVHSEVR